MALDRLAARLRGRRSAGKLFLIVSTGRRLDQVIQGIDQEGLPEPDAVICQVGTEIYVPPLAPDSKPLTPWKNWLKVDYSCEQALGFLEGIEDLVMQPQMYNTDLKTSCYLDQCPDPDEAAAEIHRRVEPFDHLYQVVWSSGRDLDILPAASGKGKAIRFLVEYKGLYPGRVVVAGDTGNDATMFREFEKGIVVANAQPELVAVAETLGSGRVYLARQPHAAGVEEGLEYYGALDDEVTAT